MTFKNDRVFFKGREVWRWSVDDGVPRNYPAEIKVKVGAMEVTVPTALLRDLWEVNDDVTGWLANDKKTFDLRITCGDGGVGMQVYFHFDTKNRKVYRTIFKDHTMVDKMSAKTSTAGR